MARTIVPHVASTPPEPPPARSWSRRLVGPGAGLVTGLLFLALAQTIDEPEIATSFSPRWWPELLAVMVCALSTAVGIKELVMAPRGEAAPLEATRAGVVRVTSVVVASLGYGALWYFVDFRVSTVVFVASLVLIIGGRGWRALILFPALATAVLYVVFDLLLKVPL